jgi:hypothetical protein
MYFWFDEEFSDDSIFFCKLTVNNVLFKKNNPARRASERP